MNIVTGAHKVQTAFTVIADRLQHVENAFAKANTSGLFTMSIGEPKYRFFRMVSGKYVEVGAEDGAIREAFHRIEITGTVPGIPGFEIVGRLDEREGARLVFNFSDIPTGDHRTRALYCAHCNTAHRRTSTYLFKNSDTNKLFQVGNTCVGHYTGTSQDITKVLLKIFGIAETFSFNESDIGAEGFGSHKQVYYLKSILHLALAIAKREGKYTRQNIDTNEIGTGGLVVNYLFGDFEDEYKAAIRQEIPNQESDADSIIEQIKAINPDTQGRFGDYYANLQALIESEYVTLKRINMVASMAAIYFRNKNQTITYKDEYFGDAGQKFTNVDCAVIKFTTHDTQFGPSQKVILRTSTGHKLTWWNNKCDVRETDKNITIGFKVKGIDTYDKNDKAVNIFYVKRA